MAVQFQLNGKASSFDGDPETPVLWVLRDYMDVQSPKYGCGMQLCGACTVHMDGQPIRSCSTPVSAVAGKRVTTIEGLPNKVGSALKEAWIQHDVPQCGYCQCGQIMAAASLLTATPKPSEAQVVQAMSGNICRCGTYSRIKAAIQTAATKL